MTGLDTNVLARYYIEDESDGEALRQRKAARALIESGQPLMVCKTVLLELEWVMRGHYQFPRNSIQHVLRHLLAMPHVVIEGRSEVEQALSGYEAGLEFADAMHHASYKNCAGMATFDDKRFARRAHKLGLAPRVILPV